MDTKLEAKNLLTQQKTKEKNHELDRVTEEITSQLEEGQERKTGGIDRHQMPTRRE